MQVATVPVDVFNPGQVFACLGLVEVAEVLFGSGSAHAAFDWSEPGACWFALGAQGSEDPIGAVLSLLERAKVVTIAPASFDLDTSQWKVETRALLGAEFPVPVPASPAALPALLICDGKEVRLDHWADSRVPNTMCTGRDNVKFWAGIQGKLGSELLQEALEVVRSKIPSQRRDPFNLSAPQSGSFRLDWRRDYVPIDAGFSLNNQKSHMRSRGYPLVEVLAAIGLSHARPLRLHKLAYRYGVAGRSSADQPLERALLPPAFLRASLGLAPLPFPTRTFTMHLDWPGQANQARCITTVSEDSDA